MLASHKQAGVSKGQAIAMQRVHGRGGASGPDAAVRRDDDVTAGASGSDVLTAQEAASAMGAELARLTRLISVWKHRAKNEPGAADRVLLARLVLEGPRRATDLAADTLLDLSTVSRQVRSLVDRGLATRQPDQEDRRGALLSATDAGHEAFDQYRRQRDAEFAVVLEKWPPKDRYQLVRLLGRLNDDLMEHHNARHCPGGRSGMSAKGEISR
jgi:DNA-binding MarR family transcriptional regulator